MSAPRCYSETVYSRLTVGFVAGPLQAGVFTIIRTEHSPGLELRRHDHEAATMVVVCSGEFEETVGSRSFRCTPGSILIKPSGAHHSNRYDERGSMAILASLPETCSVPAVMQFRQTAAMQRLAFEFECRDAASALVCETLLLGASSTGLFRADDGSLVELHVGPDQQLRGYLRDGSRVAALSSVTSEGRSVEAHDVYDDGSRAEIRKVLHRVASEKPANAEVHRDIEDAYQRLAHAVETKDFDAFQALRVADFATIPPDGVPSPASRMAERARGLLDRIQPPIATSNDILQLTTRGDEAIATVRQKFKRQIVDGESRTVYTEVTQRETWRKTVEGWKLVFVDEVRDQVRFVDGQRVP